MGRRAWQATVHEVTKSRTHLSAHACTQIVLEVKTVCCGTKQWCVNLINSTKDTFVNELKQIASKHDDQFVKDIIDELDPQPSAAPAPAKSPAPEKRTPKASDNNSDAQKKASTSMILGIIGIISAWLFALIGHVVSIIGIVLGVKEYKETGKNTGLIISIIGEVCAVISSLIGFISISRAMSLFQAVRLIKNQSTETEGMPYARSSVCA